ncbi:hypothetical protein ACNJYA_04270 [Bradyrhizobium sp. DASA03068]|uniref:hypothetical protein n=1 Tax=Bradyrhizobium sp. BLXBL-01 TaxID=3395915 RepID=UPI003F6ED1F5
MQDELLQRADTAIAASERLVDELYAAMEKARKLDEQLHCIHQRRIADELSRKQGRPPQLVASFAGRQLESCKRRDPSGRTSSHWLGNT